MARLADGLGLRQELLLEDIDSLSGGQRRRVDLMRVLFQEPELMILDEPTNHLDRSAKRWLLDELARFPGALLVVSHDLKLLDHVDHQGAAHLEPAADRMEGQLLEVRGPARGGPVPARACRRARAARDHAALHAGRLHARPAPRSGRGRPSRSTSGSSGWRSSARRSTSATRRASSSCPSRRAREPSRSRWPSSACATAATRSSSDVTFHAGRGDHIVIIGRNGAGKSSLLRCLAGVQEPTERRGRARVPTSLVGYFAQEHEQIDPDLTALDNVSDAVLKAEKDRRALLGSFGLPSKAADQMPRRRSRVESGPSSGWPCSRPARRTCCCSTSRPTTSTPRRSSPWARCSAQLARARSWR